ncbi:transmembrane amino acid transporter protein-domain-containing protein [Cokeromyces recurvatus]|uniref:transmembrane amino acid transporter protein-domain-containing protein n=1 Tax=Cokeromyces recurvatus TaxID=90255 RepID=UPI00222002B3|nr:transmembrane amino acid transporter protein-domain-containing protein [Cokeromyces recurvatus]KAI7903070.1 transmembrane amino acid transporter protein-domain-containing protein [Cokeromyces recurvatus]
MPNYSSIIDKDATTSSISSAPSLSIFSDVGASLDEHSPLLTNVTDESLECNNDQLVDFEEPNATIASASINLSNTILGTGMLAMPAAVASMGLIPGILLILYAGFTSGLGLYFLSRCAHKVGGRNASFSSLSKLTWPKLGIFFDMAIAIKCFGVAISYLIIIGDLMPQVIRSFFYHADDRVQLLMDRRFWITLSMITAVGPLSYLRKLDSLKYTSLIALFAVAYLVIIVLYHFISPNYPPPPPESIEYFHFSTKIFGQLPVFIFAFTCHQNIFSVYNELRDNSEKSIVKVICTSIGSAACIYELVAIIGYLSFGKDVLGNIILEYPQTYFVAYGRLAIVILVIFSYPLQAHPCRASIEKILDSIQPKNINRRYHFIVTTCIIITSYLVAISISKLDIILSFVGSTGSTIISFILPGLFYFKMYPSKDKENGILNWKRWVALFLILYGFMVMTICLTFNIKRLL